MRRNMIETVLGAVVLVVAGVFLVFAYTSADLRRGNGYPISAAFNSIVGLNNGADVRVSGVKVGTVTTLALDPKTYQAIVSMMIDDQVKLSTDTTAVISSESLLGGKFISLESGGDPDVLKAGGRIPLQNTQSTPGFEQLLGQVIYSLQGAGKSSDDKAAKP
jgi:phospholipid/cholesterol/gamma-HCH transport system substrate-binding protein